MADAVSETDQLDLEMRRLQIEKVRAEIAEVSLAWWKRPAYLAGLTPILIALTGIFAGWVTGYFDTQRRELASDIVDLKNEAATLMEEVSEAQQAIDLGYLRIRLAAEDADYTLGHFNAFSGEFSDAAQHLIDNMDNMPEEVTPVVNEILDLSAERFNFVQLAQQSIDELNKKLTTINTSPWVKTLETDPFLGSLGLYTTPDGQYFDVNKARFLSIDEARILLPDIER